MVRSHVHSLLRASAWLAAVHNEVKAALTVLPRWSEDIVVQLRSAYFFDEGDLQDPPARQRCSSLRDGPSCLLRSVDGNQGAGSPLFGGDSGQHVIDGILPKRLQEDNPGAFDWDEQDKRAFGGALAMATADMQQGPGQRRSPGSRSRCFRMAFETLGPGIRSLPPHFSRGLPHEVTATWEGSWSVAAASWQWPSDATAKPGASRPHAGLVLRGVEGRLRFDRRLVITQLWVDAAAMRQGACVRGLVRGWQAWRAELASPILATETDGDAESSARELVNVAQGIFAVDEVTFTNIPPEGLHIALIEVSATPQQLDGGAVGPGGGAEQAGRRVLLLTLDGSRFTPVEVPAPLDAPLWDADEVIRFNMKLLDKSSNSLGAKLRWSLTAGGCCQASESNRSCADFEYPGGICTRLHVKTIGCRRGHWNAGAEYDGRTGSCVEHGLAALEGAASGPFPAPTAAPGGPSRSEELAPPDDHTAAGDTASALLEESGAASLPGWPPAAAAELERAATREPGGCCQLSRTDRRCAEFEYPDGRCIKLGPQEKGWRPGCFRGWWNERADYDEDSGSCQDQDTKVDGEGL